MFTRTSIRFSLLCVMLCASLGNAAAVAQPAAPSQTHAAITVTAQRHNGAQAIDVSGRAPQPYSTLTLLATAKLSWDLPIVSLNRFTIRADAQGHFSAVIPMAPNFIPTSEIYIEARDEFGAIGSATFTVGRLMSGPPIPLTDDRDYQEYR